MTLTELSRSGRRVVKFQEMLSQILPWNKKKTLFKMNTSNVTVMGKYNRYS